MGALTMQLSSGQWTVLVLVLFILLVIVLMVCG